MCYQGQKKKSITMHLLSSRKESFQLPRRLSLPRWGIKTSFQNNKIALFAQMPPSSSIAYTTERIWSNKCNPIY